MLKKTLRRLGAMAMVMAMAVSVFAVNASATEVVPANTNPQMSKKLEIANEGTKIDGETFIFEVNYFTKSETTSYDEPEEGAVTASAATYATGEKGIKNFNLNIDEAKFKGPGEYYFKITEKQGTTAGMTYSTQEKMLVVHIYGDGTTPAYYIVENGSEGKNDGTFTNTYEAAKSLKIHKEVTGNFGDKTKGFRAIVTFTAPEGKTVNSTITYGTGSITPREWTVNNEGNLTATAEITLKHGDNNDITFVNVPYGVTCTVEEDSYKSEGYDTSYSQNNGAAVSAAEMKVTVTNDKNANVPTGVIMTIAPYALMVVLAGAFAVVFLTRRNRAE